MHRSQVGLSRTRNPFQDMAATENIWNLLVASRLVSAETLAEVRSQYHRELDSQGVEDAAAILKWLQDGNRISGYQREVLAEGQPGPFQFGPYRVHALYQGGPLDGAFRAQHLPSNHPVRLSFLGGKGAQDARRWAEIRQLGPALTQVTSPFVSRCYELLDIEDYRFVVFEDLPGKSLAEKLTDKARLPWLQALQALELLAVGLTETHAAGLCHGRIWPGSIWLQRGGICQLMWQVPDLNFRPLASTARSEAMAFQSPGERDPRKGTSRAVRPRGDLFSLGAVAFRLITGKPPRFQATDLEQRQFEVQKHLTYCEKYELPENVSRFLELLWTADLSDELKDAAVATRLLGTILGSQSIRADIDPPAPTWVAYRDALSHNQRNRPFVEALDASGRTSSRNGQTSSPTDRPDFAKLTASAPVLSARERLAKRQRSPSQRWPLQLGSLILFAAILGGAWLGGLFSPAATTRDRVAADAAANAPTPTSPDSSRNVDDTGVPKKEPGVFRPQTLVSDDTSLPWESPTSGAPMDVSWLPPSPDFLLALRPKRLVADPQGRRFLQAWGKDFEAWNDAFTLLTKTDLQDAERCQISWHPQGTGQYARVSVFEWTQPLTQEVLWERLGKPEILDDTASGFRYFPLDEQLVFFEPDDSGTVRRFGVGPARFLTESFQSMGLPAAGRSLGRLIERSDRDRDVTLIFLNSGLLSEEGQRIFAGKFQGLRRPLNLFLDDRIQAVLWSLHFDDGCYLEWMSDQTAEMTNQELADWVPKTFAGLQDQVTNRVSQIPPHPYWSRVQMRIDNMLIEAVRQMRVGQERDGVVANCWLPAAAPHNLVTAVDLMLNVGPIGNGMVDATVVVPGTLEALLSTPRDLTVTSDPDLINLLRDLEQEIREDHPSLPFAFHIRLLGNDLAAEGITQNQRPGKIEANQQPLGAILAQIMFQANSDKSATGPDDERCKLVWVIGSDPDNPGQPAVLVTTRKAAAQKGWQLPEFFQAP